LALFFSVAESFAEGQIAHTNGTATMDGDVIVTAANPVAAQSGLCTFKAKGKAPLITARKDYASGN
jgi:hypothetical protein